MANKKTLVKTNPLKTTLVDIDKNLIVENKPHIGITYLDKNKYGIKHLIDCYRGDKKYVDMLESFIEKSRQYESLQELIKNHQSHKSGRNNKDKNSRKKIEQIKSDYNVETGEMIHLHALAKGNGEFVLHGFTINNVFEIVWLDCKHEEHNC